MVRQLLPNTNEMLQCATVSYSESGGADSAKLNKVYVECLAPASNRKTNKKKPRFAKAKLNLTREVLVADARNGHEFS
jgi:hypothetical protein